MNVIDKDIIIKRFALNFESYNRMAIVQRQIARKLACLLQKAQTNSYNRVLEIGCGTGFLTQQILSNYSIEAYVLNDLVDSAYQQVLEQTKILNFKNFSFISGDAEKTDFPKNFNAILSTSTFQWFQNLEVFFSKVHTLLDNNGILAFSTFGNENFKEIKSTLNIGLHYSSLQNIVDILSPNYTLIHAEEWTQEELFKNPGEVLRHMKLTGVNGVAKQVFTKRTLLDFNEKYQALFSRKDESVHLSFHPIIIIAKKK